MSEEAFDVRLDQLERALKVIGSIQDNPDLQAASFSWLMQESERPPISPAERSTEAPKPPDPGSASQQKAKNGGARRTPKTSAVAQDKSVQLSPANGTSWIDYVTEKSPANLNEKYTVAIYWLKEVANLPTATINQLVYLFIAAKWNIPADPKNKASVAGVSGLIDSADMQNLKVTALGTALVLNDLPRKKSK